MSYPTGFTPGERLRHKKSGKRGTAAATNVRKRLGPINTDTYVPVIVDNLKNDGFPVAWDAANVIRLEEKEEYFGFAVGEKVQHRITGEIGEVRSPTKKDNRNTIPILLRGRKTHWQPRNVVLLKKHKPKPKKKEMLRVFPGDLIRSKMNHKIYYTIISEDLTKATFFALMIHDSGPKALDFTYSVIGKEELTTDAFEKEDI